MALFNSSSLNFTDLEIYNSTSSLTNKFTDYVNLFVLPSISVYGVGINFVSILASARLSKKDIMNLYMLYASILNFIFSLICVFLAIIRCGSLCSYSYTYEAKVYELYVYLYVCYSILLASQLLEAVIAVNRLLAFSKMKHKFFYCTANMFKVIAPVIIAASFLLYACNVIAHRYVKRFGVLIKENNESYEFLYKVVERDFTDSLKILLFVVNCLENIVLQIVLFVIDMVILAKYVIFTKHKRKTKSSILIFFSN